MCWKMASKRKKGAALGGRPFFTELEFKLERELGDYLKDASIRQGTRERAVRRSRRANG